MPMAPLEGSLIDLASHRSVMAHLLCPPWLHSSHLSPHTACWSKQMPPPCTQAVPHAPHSAGVGLSEAAGHGPRPAPELRQVSGRRPAKAHGRRMSECGGQPTTLKSVSPRIDLQGAVILPRTRIPVQHSARGFLPSCAQWPPPHPFSRPTIFNPPPPGGKQDGCFARYKSMCTNADKIADTALHLRLPAEGHRCTAGQ